MEKVNLAEKLETITEHWRPKIVGELNGQEVKLVKFQGTFVWHHHDEEDELFLGIHGRFRIEFRDRSVEIGPASASSFREASSIARSLTKRPTCSSSSRPPRGTPVTSRTRRTQRRTAFASEPV